MRVLSLCLTVTILLAACGDRNSGFSPAENAVTANPEDTIALRARDYELPPATPAPDGPTASYDTGDSSGGRTLTLDTLNPALERVADTEDEVAEAVAENALEDGRSTTIADETSEGDAAEATGGDLNIVTDPAARPADAVVDPATGGEVELENTVEETDGETAAVQEDASADAVVDAAAVNSAVAADDATTEQAEDTSAEQMADAEETVATETTSDTAATTEEAAAETETAETETAAETGGATEAATPAVLAQADFDWQQLGETTYANCVACHQQNGQGIPAAFPPLAGHINELYNVEGGRKYIINVVLYGLQGEIEVLGQTYNGLMTAWPQLSDEEIAATLNHELTSWGNDALLEDFSPILPDEVAAERADELTSAQVLELRPELP